MKQLNCDVLIIGAGGAGLRAAIEATKHKQKVLVVTKTLLGKAHTVMAEGGVAAAVGSVDKEDNWKVHFLDTFQKGQFISDPIMAEIHAKESPARVYELEEWGALFDRTPEGKILSRPFGGHTYRRVCHVGDRTGLEILRTLQDKAIQNENFSFIEEIFITKIFTSKNKAVGALAINLRSGEYEVINAKSIVLASGGLGKMYKVSSNSGETTGNGFALALDAGAEIKDMEFVQFHPTGMVYPESVKGLLVTEAVRGEGGLLTNIKGERFMEKYSPKSMELSSRDVVARSNYFEIIAGRGTPNGGVYLDISFKGEDFIKKKLGRMYEQFIEFAHLDITKDKMEVAPTAHYMMGGVNVKGAETNVKGLFAAGEVAAGLHGANRLGGNSLSDLLVFGKIAGEHAAVYAKNSKLEKIKQEDIDKEVKRVESFLSDKKSSVKSSGIKSQLQEIMWKYVSIVRNKKGLAQALTELKNLRDQLKHLKAPNVRRYNPEWIAILDLHNMITVAEVIINSALIRKESRGAHYRDDYPATDKEWQKNIVFYLINNKLFHKVEDVGELRAELKTLLNERIKEK